MFVLVPVFVHSDAILYSLTFLYIYCFFPRWWEAHRRRSLPRRTVTTCRRRHGAAPRCARNTARNMARTTPCTRTPWHTPTPTRTPSPTRTPRPPCCRIPIYLLLLHQWRLCLDCKYYFLKLCLIHNFHIFIKLNSRNNKKKGLTTIHLYYLCSLINYYR